MAELWLMILKKGTENASTKNNIVTRKVCWEIGGTGLNLLRLAEFEASVSISYLDECSNHHDAKKAAVAISTSTGHGSVLAVMHRMTQVPGG